MVHPDIGYIAMRYIPLSPFTRLQTKITRHPRIARYDASTATGGLPVGPPVGLQLYKLAAVKVLVIEHIIQHQDGESDSDTSVQATEG